MHLLFCWFHRALARITAGWRWFWQNVAYLFEIFAAFVILLFDVSLLSFLLGESFVKNMVQWPFPLLTLPVLMLFYLLVLLGLPVMAFYLGRDAIVQIRMWSDDPNGQTLALIHQQRALLVYLRLKAQQENEKLSYWKPHTLADPTQPRVLSKYAGPYSLYYAIMSAYLRLPMEQEGQTSENGQALVAVLMASVSFSLPLKESLPMLSLPDQLSPTYALFLFGGPHIRLYGTKVIDAPIKSFRQRELLGYLGNLARDEECTRDDIVDAVHEAHSSGEKDEGEEEEGALGEKDYKKQAEVALANDLKDIRARVAGACQEAGLPYVDPVPVEKGTGARYRLAESYIVEDVTRLERLMQYLAALKQKRALPSDLEEFRKEYQAVLALYADGFLGRTLRKKAASWYRPSFTRYQDLHHRLLWDLAEYESALGQRQQGEERKTSFEQAASFYERCAILTAPTAHELEQGTTTPLSEHALRQWMVVSGLLGNVSAVYHIYHSYFKALRRKSDKVRPDPQTEQLFHKITGTSEEA